jgi:hypothetical protein
MMELEAVACVCVSVGGWIGGWKDGMVVRWCGGVDVFLSSSGIDEKAM